MGTPPRKVCKKGWKYFILPGVNLDDGRSMRYVVRQILESRIIEIQAPSQVSMYGQKTDRMSCAVSSDTPTTADAAVRWEN
jgi:hypothetical protein